MTHLGFGSFLMDFNVQWQNVIYEKSYYFSISYPINDVAVCISGCESDQK